MARPPLRLARYLTADGARPGLLDDHAQLRDLSYVLIDIRPEHLGPDDLDILRSIEPETLPIVQGAPRLAPPLANIGRVFVEGAPADDLAIDGPYPVQTPSLRFGLALAIGAPRWSGARMLAAYDAPGRRLWLGPWIAAPERPAKTPGLDLAAAMDAAGDAAAGDIALVLQGPDAHATHFAIAPYGEQHCAPRPDGRPCD